MFYKPSFSRSALASWLHELLNSITFQSKDRAALDSLTISEVLDLTYLDSSDFNTAISANTLFPAYVEQEESKRGYGAASSFEVIFPVEVESEQWAVEICLRAGQPSMLGIGRGKVFPKETTNISLPKSMLEPVIKGTRYELKELQGERLQKLAGPLELVEKSFLVEITNQNEKFSDEIKLPSSNVVYAYLDEKGHLHQQINGGDSIPLDNVPQKSNYHYLRAIRLGCHLNFELSWKTLSPGRVLLAFALRNNTLPRESAKAREELLGSLVLPHVQLNLVNAKALFPAQQYAGAKKQFFKLTEEERREEAKRRLYQVSQSGCIATINPQNASQVSLTTFGVFDIPREIPAKGPLISELITSPESLLAEMPGHSNEAREFVHNYWILISNILLAAAEAFRIKRFREFQWDAIITAIELQATSRQKATTIVRAPTNAGKTLVFMVNAAISSLCREHRSTSVLLFPTRLLNEDMFRRLILFVYYLRQTLPEVKATGGILMGTSDALYKMLLDPALGDVMYHYGNCPACLAPSLIAQSNTDGTRVIPACEKCGHQIDYMYHSREATAYLPDLLIATPDKLFYEATASKYESYRYPLFRASSIKCNGCGRVFSESALALKPQDNKCKQKNCKGIFEGDSFVKPIRYVGFDEVHSLYGETATYLSVFLATLESMQRVLTNEKDLFIRYEAATATIANEKELLQALTRRDDSKGEIIAIPPDNKLHQSFSIDIESVRQRILITMPSRVSTRDAFIKAILNSYTQLRRLNDSTLKTQLAATSEPGAWDFILGYVFKKQDGLDFQRALGQFYRNRFGENLKIDFLSGEAPKNQISHILQKALDGDLDILLANLVVSLGIDIHGLNHMFMFGVPRSFTEYVQTAGRTGRGNSPGHVSILLVPYASRDTYLYRHFHAILTDVSGYYDVLPVRSSNLHSSNEIFGNVAKSLLAALCLRLKVWSHRQGITEVQNAAKREKIINAITIALCNLPDLQGETAKIVTRKYDQLINEVVLQNKFLSEVMLDPQQDWLIYSLRGRSGNTVKVSCTDQLLLELLSQEPSSDEGEEVLEEISDNE
ncbi:MAG: helicase-related protein [Pyrinomonadaceae bacterium]